METFVGFQTLLATFFGYDFGVDKSAGFVRREISLVKSKKSLILIIKPL